MATLKYINGVGKNNQYTYRYFDNIIDPNQTNIDMLVSPDEIEWYFKKDSVSTTVKMTLPGQDNLYLGNNSLTTNI